MNQEIGEYKDQAMSFQDTIEEIEKKEIYNERDSKKGLDIAKEIKELKILIEKEKEECLKIAKEKIDVQYDPVIRFCEYNKYRAEKILELYKSKQGRKDL